MPRRYQNGSMRCAFRRHIHAGVALTTVMTLIVSNAMANGSITTTEYSANSLIRIVIAVMGGIIAVLGVFLAFKNAGALSNVSFSRARVDMKGVSQGVVITLLGGAILIAGIYFLPEKASITETKGKSIEIDSGGTKKVAD